MSRKSKVWEFFEPKSNDLAKCLKCPAVIKTTGGSTSGLMKHARQVHKLLTVSASQESKTRESGEFISTMFLFVVKGHSNIILDYFIAPCS